MYYGLKRDSTIQILRIGQDPYWCSDPPPGCSAVELDNLDLPEPQSQNDPTGSNGKLLIGELGIVTPENKELRRMTNGEIDQYCLSYLKKYRFTKINEKTDEILMSGFEYPPVSGNYFSLDIQTQLRILGCDYVRELPEFTYPVKWNTLDDVGEIEIDDAAEMRAFFLTGLASLRAIVDSGTNIKTQIRQATNASGVLAINDPR